jgi:hypothetical protein
LPVVRQSGSAASRGPALRPRVLLHRFDRE